MKKSLTSLLVVTKSEEKPSLETSRNGGESRDPSKLPPQVLLAGHGSESDQKVTSLVKWMGEPKQDNGWAGGGRLPRDDTTPRSATIQLVSGERRVVGRQLEGRRDFPYQHRAGQELPGNSKENICVSHVSQMIITAKWADGTDNS